MTYTPNTPQATQTIAFTQPLIENNFTYIDTAMKIDHAWNGNEINSQADGSHQKISLPNQPTDITGALPTGISNIQYAISGNLYAWNGAKQVLSGISGTGTLAITTSAQSVGTIPADCIGVILVETNQVGIFTLFGFLNISGSGSVNTPVVQPSVTQLQVETFTNQIFIKRLTGSNYNARYKFICWPI